jgi:hypothetical protein
MLPKESAEPVAAGFSLRHARRRLKPAATVPPAAFGKPVCRLGLASRSDAALSADDVLYAVERGVSFLNWPGVADSPAGPDGVSDAVASLGKRREDVVVCMQFGSHSAGEAADELRTILATFRTDYVDVVTLYYVEHPEEWEQLTATDGALT